MGFICDNRSSEKKARTLFLGALIASSDRVIKQQKSVSWWMYNNRALPTTFHLRRDFYANFRCNFFTLWIRNKSKVLVVGSRMTFLNSLRRNPVDDDHNKQFKQQLNAGSSDVTKNVLLQSKWWIESIKNFLELLMTERNAFERHKMLQSVNRLDRRQRKLFPLFLSERE